MLRGFFAIVPKPVQLWALFILSCTVLIGLAAGYQTAVWQTMFLYGAAALLAGSALAIWMLCLGFVFADAQRRAMRSILWVLVAALFPHLLGFLLYFVMRQPIASACTQCGHTIPLQQRFCSWCGFQQPVATSGNWSPEVQ